MRRWMPFAFLLGVAAVGFVLWEMRGRGGGSASPAIDHKVLGVEELMRGVDRLRGTVQVEGVVSGRSPDEQTLALIDIDEFRRCGVTTCARLTLPVRWMGPMPSVEDTVLLEGEVKDSGGKFLFVAGKLEKAEKVEHLSGASTR